MNKPIRTLSVFCLVLFLALLVNGTYLMYVQADELTDRPGNRRVVVESFSRERGPIVVGREPVARSVPVDDQYEYQRRYPLPRRFAHATGFFSYFSQTAVEQSYNDVLSGEDSRLFVNRLVDMMTSGSPQGGSVQLTLDRRAQNAAFDGLQALGPGTRGAVVALEPATGRLLAMVSTPSYDPNRLASHDLSQVTQAYDELEQADGQPLLNRSIQTTLPPGSTFKLVTAAAALESGNYAGAEATVPGGSSFSLPQSSTSVGNYDGGDCGGQQITFTQAMQVSCNVTFLSLANEVGTEQMRETAEGFGFNSDNYLDALSTRLATSRYPPTLDEPQTAMSGIGQSDVAATPLQMAMVAAGIANQGTVMKPYLVEELRSPDLDVLDRTDPQELSHAVSPRTADELTSMLVATVDGGTATSAQIPGIKVAGKTGTAESGSDRPPYAWFVSFAPAEDPEVAVAVLVESTSIPRDEIAGGLLGGPIAKAVMQAVIQNR